MRKNNSEQNKGAHNEAAKEMVRNLKTMRKPCDEKAPKLKRCLAGGFTVAYVCGVLSSTLAGCNTSENIIKSPVSAEEVMQKGDAGTELPDEGKDMVNSMTNDRKEEKKLLTAEELPNIYQNNAERAAESVKVQLGEEAYQNIIDTLGASDNAKNQGDYIADIIDEVKNTDGEGAVTKVMRACGYQCIDEHILSTAKKLYAESADMEEFLQKLSISLGGSNLTFKDNKITAVYNQCFCYINDSGKRLGKCYCQCSCGWYEKLFATVLEVPVNVELVKSIKGNDDHCQFEITY